VRASVRRRHRHGAHAAVAAAGHAPAFAAGPWIPWWTCCVGWLLLLAPSPGERISATNSYRAAGPDEPGTGWSGHGRRTQGGTREST
jgi:hypothetical protein